MNPAPTIQIFSGNYRILDGPINIYPTEVIKIDKAIINFLGKFEHNFGITKLANISGPI